MEQTTVMKNTMPYPAAVTETKIGNTIFVVSSHFDTGSRESAAVKMGRVLKQKSREKEASLQENLTL